MTNKIKIFIAYAREDKEYLNELRKHLKPFDRNNIIKIWYDGEIAPGTTWEEAIKEALHNADIILLLVSANSLASDYFYDKEVSNALERHKNNQVLVIPVILGYCAWKVTELSNLQALPTDGIPIVEWEPKSKAYADIITNLKKSIDLLQSSRIKEKRFDENIINEQELKIQQNDLDTKNSETKELIDEKRIENQSVEKKKYRNPTTPFKEDKRELTAHQLQSNLAKDKKRYSIFIALILVFGIIECILLSSSSLIYKFGITRLIGMVFICWIFGLFAFAYSIKLGVKEKIAALLPIITSIICFSMMYAGGGGVTLDSPQIIITLLSSLIIIFLLSYKYLISFYDEKLNTNR